MLPGHSNPSCLDAFDVDASLAFDPGGMSAPLQSQVETAASIANEPGEIQFDTSLVAPEAKGPGPLGQNLLDPATRTAHENLILQVAGDLALVQALNPRVKDLTGFSNADFSLGFRLVASENITALATLLRLYPEQAAARGLDMDVLRDISESGRGSEGAGRQEQDETSFSKLGNAAGGRGDRAMAQGHLREIRDGLRGEIGWHDVPDEKLVLLGGIGIDYPIRCTIKAAAIPGGPTGVYRVPYDHLLKTVTMLDRQEASVERWDDLKALAASLPPPKESVQMDDLLAAIDPNTVVVNATKTRTGDWMIGWTNPFSPDGTKLREMVRKAGGEFVGRSKEWAVPAVGAEVLSVVLQDEPGFGIAKFVEAVGAPSARALEIAENIDLVTLKVLASRLDGMVIQPTGYAKGVFGPIYNEDLVGISRGVSAQYLREEKANLVSWDDIGTYLDQVEKVLNVECYEVAYAYREHLARMTEEVQERVAIVVPNLTPSGKPLFPHQQEGVTFLLDTLTRTVGLKGGILADEMGLGKTATAVISANLLTHDRPGGGHILVVVPATLKLNWAKEIRLWIGPDETVDVVNGSKNGIDPTARWTVINYNILTKLRGLLGAVNFDVALLDEAHMIKERGTNWTKTLLGSPAQKGEPEDFGLLSKVAHVFPMTGTPMLNRPKELFNLLKAVNHPLSRKGFFGFGSRYCNGFKDAYGWDFSGASNIAELGERMGDAYLKRLKSRVMSLPPKMPNQIDIELEPAQLKEYRELASGVMERTSKKKASKKVEVDPGATVAAEVEEPEVEVAPEDQDSILGELNRMKMATALVKTPFTQELAQEIVDQGNKVIIFSNYLKPLDDLQEHFGPLAVRIDGSVTQARRQQAVDRFQEDDSVQVFLGQMQAAGIGITLTRAQDIIINDLPWTPGLLSQAEDRAHRIGQEGTLTIHYPTVSGTFDAQLLKVLNSKRAVIGAFEASADEAAALEKNSSKSMLHELLKEMRKAERAAERAANPVKRTRKSAKAVE